ncbi:hypothetical protein ZYGM_000671 [Zygosaccharomyces mellis]|uniref:Uncharacterized protein n=1 Tax=Zygosaccharomyces mellis TaxID=42258 RepID=A0A4C2EA40_9SACH|nr:hypothetical protein ZYGM_000671 [Zygosaccharomyces mellis]
MVDEVSLSLEETNAIRRQLGLKTIEPEHKQQRIEQKHNPEETKIEDEGFQFMNDDKARALRKRLSSIRSMTSVSRRQDDNEDWLSKIGTQKRPKPVKVVHEDEPEDELPLMKIAHGINEIGSKNGVILTLKERSINDEAEDNDTLENTEVAQSQRESENMRLKKLSRHRKFNPLQVSSFDLDKDEQSGNNGGPLVTVGGENKVDEVKASSQGNIKVATGELDDEEDEQSTDFQPVRIKKRNRRDVKSRVKLPSKIQSVALVDEDEGVEEAQGQLPIAPRPLLKNKIQTPQEIAQQIQREKIEKKERSANLAQMNKNAGFIIDENVQFLESLKANMVENEIQEERQEQEDPEQQKSSRFSISAPTESQALDFSTGLASTLQLLQKKELLPSSNNVSQGDHSEINLVYRDENGIPLTTKEAYKKLSQKFHGTKSNKRKREKFESKLRARHNGNTNNSEREWEQ